MKHSTEDIRFIQNVDDVIALVVKTVGKSFSVIDTNPTATDHTRNETLQVIVVHINLCLEINLS